MGRGFRPPTATKRRRRKNKKRKKRKIKIKKIVKKKKRKKSLDGMGKIFYRNYVRKMTARGFRPPATTERRLRNGRLALWRNYILFL